MTALEIMAEMDSIIHAAKKELKPCYGSFSLLHDGRDCNQCADSEACAAVTAAHMKEIEAELAYVEEVEFNENEAEARLADMEVEEMKMAEATAVATASPEDQELLAKLMKGVRAANREVTASPEDQELLAKLMKGVRAANREVTEEAYIAVLARRPTKWDEWRNVLDQFADGKKKYDFACKFMLKLRKLKMIEWSGWTSDDATWMV